MFLEETGCDSLTNHTPTARIPRPRDPPGPRSYSTPLPAQQGFHLAPKPGAHCQKSLPEHVSSPVPRAGGPVRVHWFLPAGLMEMLGSVCPILVQQRLSFDEIPLPSRFLAFCLNRPKTAPLSITMEPDTPSETLAF